MPYFAYKAADQRGQTIDGVMEASDARSVVERLQRDAYFPIQVAPQRERLVLSSLARGASGSRGVRGRDLVAYTQQLATLLEAGLPLDRALAIQEGLAASPGSAASPATCSRASARGLRWARRSASTIRVPSHAST